MAKDLQHRSTSKKVRRCSALLSNGTPCDSPTEDAKYRYCTAHYEAYRDSAAGCKAVSQRVAQMKQRACLTQWAVNNMRKIAKLDAAASRAKEWRDGVVEEIRKREQHHDTFFPNGADEGHFMWLEGLRQDKSMADKLLLQLETRRREIAEKASLRAEAWACLVEECGDQFARTVEDTIDQLVHVGPQDSGNLQGAGVALPVCIVS